MILENFDLGLDLVRYNIAHDFERKEEKNKVN